MVNAKINGIEIQVEKGTTILDAAREKGIRIPTLCYLKEINEIGACRVCLVEVGKRILLLHVIMWWKRVWKSLPTVPRCSLQDVPTWN